MNTENIALRWVSRESYSTQLAPHSAWISLMLYFLYTCMGGALANIQYNKLFTKSAAKIQIQQATISTMSICLLLIQCRTERKHVVDQPWYFMKNRKICNRGQSLDPLKFLWLFQSLTGNLAMIFFNPSLWREWLATRKMSRKEMHCMLQYWILGTSFLHWESGIFEVQ